MLLIGIIALTVPVNVDHGADTVECGSGFSGISDTPGLRDAGHRIADAQYPLFAGEQHAKPSVMDCSWSTALYRRLHLVVTPTRR